MKKTERTWRTLLSAMAVGLSVIRPAFGQTDIDDLLRGLENLERTNRVEASATPSEPSTVFRRVKRIVDRLSESDEGAFGSRVRRVVMVRSPLQQRFVERVRALVGKDTSSTNAYRYFRREAGGDGYTETLRVSFSREIRFASLQRELERTVSDLERRFADCGFRPVALSGNAYLNYVEDVGALAVFLSVSDGDAEGERVYTMEVSLMTDLLVYNPADAAYCSTVTGMRRTLDFGDRRTVEAMLSRLGRSALLTRKVKCRRLTACEDLSGGDVSLPVYEERDTDSRWKELVVNPGKVPETAEGEDGRKFESLVDEGVFGLDTSDERERRYEAMKFMNDFIRPCENGFGWTKPEPEVSADQAAFVRQVREITGRSILPTGTEPPFETLAEMRRRYHEPMRRICPTSVDWNVPVNSFRYFPHLPESLAQSPHSATLFAGFSASCTRDSVWNEMCALARDLERRFAVCGFRPQEVEDGGYVNYRPNVGGIVIHLLSRWNGEERIHVLQLHFTTRLFDGRSGSSYGDLETDRLLRRILTQGTPPGHSVCSACIRHRLRDYCGNLDWMKGPPARGWFSLPFDLPVYERRDERASSGFSILPKRDWRSVLRPVFAERVVSCFDEGVFLEDLPLDVGGAAVPADGLRPDAEGRRYEVAESFYNRFLRSSRPWQGGVPDVAICEICRGSSHRGADGCAARSSP